MSEPCSERVWGGSGWGFRPCTRTGRVERDGKWYCGQHDPAAVQARRKDQHERWEAKWTREAERHEYTNGCESTCRAAGVTLDDLRTGRVRVTIISHDMEQQP